MSRPRLFRWHWRSREFRLGPHTSLSLYFATRRRVTESPRLTHWSRSRDPFAADAACGFQPANGERFGMTSEYRLVTCPDCLVRVFA